MPNPYVTTDTVLDRQQLWHLLGIATCCNGIPYIWTPLHQCQSISGDSRLGAVTHDGGTHYRKLTITYAGGGVITYTENSTHITNLGGQTLTARDVTVSSTGDQSGGSTQTFSLPANVTTARTAALGGMSAALNWDTMTLGNHCEAELEHITPAFEANPYMLTATWSRYRWKVPTEENVVPGSPNFHAGTYYKIVWDIVETPHPSGTPVTVETDNVWEWEAPENTLSEWFYIAPPSVPGVRSISNIRIYITKNSPYGNVPRRLSTLPFGVF